METLSDNQLMTRVQNGNVEQLGLLFERYHRMLFSFFYNRNNNIQLSEDLVQNVFLRVIKYKHNFQGRGEFKHWLFHIAKNVQADHFRKKKLKYADSLDDWKDKVKDHDQIQSQQLIQHEEMQQLKAALDRLDPEKKQIIIWSKFQGLKYKEIGERLGCTEGAVKVKVFRALKALKKQFQKLEN